MRHKEIIAIASQLEESWISSQSESDWGSGGDRITMTHEVEREFFEEECLNLGLNDSDYILVMKQLGYDVFLY